VRRSVHDVGEAAIAATSVCPSLCVSDARRETRPSQPRRQRTSGLGENVNCVVVMGRRTTPSGHADLSQASEVSATLRGFRTSIYLDVERRSARRGTGAEPVSRPAGRHATHRSKLERHSWGVGGWGTGAPRVKAEETSPEHRLRCLSRCFWPRCAPRPPASELSCWLAFTNVLTIGAWIGRQESTRPRMRGRQAKGVHRHVQPPRAPLRSAPMSSPSSDLVRGRRCRSRIGQMGLLGHTKSDMTPFGPDLTAGNAPGFDRLWFA
jgi:hypothetical protein